MLYKGIYFVVVVVLTSTSVSLEYGVSVGPKALGLGSNRASELRVYGQGPDTQVLALAFGLPSIPLVPTPPTPPPGGGSMEGYSSRESMKFRCLGRFNPIPHKL